MEKAELERAKEACKEIVLITRHIVNHPDDVEVDVVPVGFRLVVALRTNPRDVGQVIGRHGHLSTSLRSFLSAVAGKYKIKIDLDYVTEDENARGAGRELSA